MPPMNRLDGSYCRLELLVPEVHAEGLLDAFLSDVEAQDWTYLPFGPFDTREAAADWIRHWSGQDDILHYVIADPATGSPRGIASFMRIQANNGCIEIGGILYSRSLCRTVAATEAMFLMLDQVFALGYRRCEWKCDVLNEPSRRAALRLGFSFEGIFRQATMYKGRSRDTAWYAITDKDWETLRDIVAAWLQADNFDGQGRQKASLSVLTRPYLKVIDSSVALSQ